MNFATSSTAGRLGWSATVVGRSTTTTVLDETAAAPDGHPIRHPLKAKVPEGVPAAKAAEPGIPC
jgi:hypothetical protein